MEFLPRTLGTRPRMACEVRPEGVVAARADDASGLLSAVSRVALPAASSSIPDRAALVAALRQALDAVCIRGREVTVVVPDSSVRVLLLDFDALPAKPAEALPVVRFRLKKLLPFDADDAAVSYQVMSTSRGVVRAVAVAMPRETLAAYELAVREAGFEPGTVLPSTLAAAAGLVEGDSPVLMVNATPSEVTTAIIGGGILLLHRALDLREESASANSRRTQAASLPLVDRESSAEEWSRAYADPSEASAGIQTAVLDREIAREIAKELVGRAAPTAASELIQAVSRAAAWFEDTLGAAPRVLLASGTLGADTLATLLEDAGIGPLPVLEIIDPQMLGPGASTSGRIPPGWLAGVRGALAG